MGGTELSSLKDAFVSNAESASLFARILLYGVIAEVFVEFAAREDKSWREWGASLVCAAAVAIGVWGEIHFGDLASAAAGGLQAEADRQVAASRNDAAQAIERAAEATARAAEANKRAAEANERALIIEARLAPRQIPREPFVKSLSESQAKGFITVLYERDDLEAYALALRLLPMLREAGWTTGRSDGKWEPVATRVSDNPEFSDLPSVVVSGGNLSSPSGITITTRESWLFPPTPALNALVHAFVDSGIAWRDGRDATLADNSFKIVIGPKP